VEQLSLSLGDRPTLVDVSLSLDPGQIVGLIGPNGAGKSTFLRAINGFFPDFEGSVHIGDTELRSLAPSDRAKRITYVGNDLETDFPLTTEEFVSMGTFSLGNRKGTGTNIQTVLDETECSKFRDRFLGELSSGERQRAHLARALLQGSQWICLDESFSRLDLHHQARMGALLKKYVSRGFSFLFVSHDLNFTTDWSDRCVLLSEGKIVAEGPTEKTVNAENLRKLYPDAEIILTPHPVSGALKVYFQG
jgi:iron complex transport system ATP-binding protein